MSTTVNPHPKTGQANKDVRAWSANQPLGLLLTAFCEAHPQHGRRSVENILTTLLKRGEVVNICKLGKTRYFAKAEQRDAARPVLEAQWAAERRAVKQAQNKRRGEQLRISRGTKPKVNPTVLRKPGTASGTSHAVKVRGIAHLPGEADISRAKVTIALTPPGRFEVPSDFKGVFSMAGIGRDVQTGEAW